MTKLDKPLRREIEIDSQTYTLTLYPHTLRLARKGRREGVELAWTALLKLDVHEQEPHLITLRRTQRGTR
ncbi:MAG: hypothetical protein ACREPF_12635 [Rhodanobacteraceae bacterium]